MLSRWLRMVALTLAVGLLSVAGFSPGVEARAEEEPVSIWRVFVDSTADVELLVNGGYDLVEGRGEDYLLVVGESDVAADLRLAGLRVTLDRQLTQIPGVRRQIEADGEMTNLAASFFGGYRTVDEHYAHLDAVAAAYPNLATVHDYGDSWLNVNGRANPNELKVICITAKQAGDCALDPNSAKPRALIMAAIHARELQTSELAWRLIDELTQNYASDADIRHMLDTTEVWVVPVVNPDGREIVESGGNSPYLQRKNANDNAGNCAVPPTGSNHHGVDLNRNASSFNYGGIGTTSSPCAQTYRGTGPASEPEQAGLETLFTQLWPDQKNGPNDPVSATATGTFITLHSYGNLVLLPPGDQGVTPNDTELRKLAFRMSHFNGYETGTGPEILYGTTGTTDDWVHYTLGVAGFTYEVSPSNGSCSGFTPAYSCIDSSIWPLNRDALLYAIKVAGAPYVTPQGPTTTSVSAEASVEVGSPLGLSAVVNDNAYGNSGIARPSAATVTEAEYYLDVSPSAGGTPVPLASADGSFNEANETTTATVDTTGLSPGEHTIFVRGRNAAGFWGPVTALSFEATAQVDDPPVADDQALSTPVDTPLAVTLTATDPEGQPVTYAVLSGPSSGSLSGTAPNLVYTPDSGFVGSDSFTFAASDGAAASVPATVTITVGSVSGIVFEDDFETDQGWVTDPSGSDNATTGHWGVSDPAQTASGSSIMQLGATASGSQALVTDGRAGTSVGTYDIDSGTTSVRSPDIALPAGASLTLSFDHYLAHLSNSSSADFLRVTVVGPGASETVHQELGADNNDSAAWATASVNLDQFAGQTIHLLIEASDSSNASLVEAGIDDVVIEAN